MSGGTGDADLYVRFGSAPTTTTYDCRPYKSGNNESCAFAVGREGTYYVMINGFSAYSGVSLNVTWKGGYLPLENGVDAVVSGAAGFSQVYTLTVPEGVKNLKFSISGGTGNADIYLSNGRAPGHAAYDCRDVKENNEEACISSQPAGGKYYLMVFGAKAFADVKVQGRWVP
jgi:hypothetical protein